MRATAGQASCELAGEAIILHFGSGLYFGLDGVGARIWELLAEPRRVEAILAVLLAEYDVAPEPCSRDLLALLEELRGAGLLEVLGDGAA